MDESAFGRYRLLNPLGEGPTGRVFRAFDTETERFVAVKLMSSVFVDDDALHRRFLRQVGAAATLYDSGVLPIHDFGEVDGQPFVTMQLADGDLSAYLSSGWLDSDRALRVTSQAADALDAAHRIGLVHGDLKPSNILLGGDGNAYLSDFGCYGVGQQSSAYTAPEAAISGTDPRSDIYSLTRILQDCLGGRPVDGVPGAGIDTVLAKGMHADPDERYQSASALTTAAASALGLAAPPAPPVAPPPPPLAPPPSSTRTDPVPLAGGQRAARSWWRRHLVAITSAVSAVAVAVAVPLIVVTGDRSQVVPALLTSAEVDSIMGTGNLVLIDRVDHGLDQFGATLPAECTTVGTFAGTSTYEGFPVTSMRTAQITETGNNPTHSVWQSVVVMASPADATGYLASESRDWTICKGRPFAVLSTQLVMNTLDISDDLLVAGVTTADGNQHCQRVTAAAHNLIIETVACGAVISDEAKTMAAELVARAG